MKKPVHQDPLLTMRFPLLFVIWSFFGCTNTIDLVHADKYRDQTLEVITKSQARYQIASGWTIDSTNGITGRGLMTTGDSTQSFRGTIPPDDIERLSVRDDLNPALLIISGALVTVLLIFIRV